MPEKQAFGWSRFVLAQPTQNREPLPASGRAGRNLPAAVSSALILVAALAIALIFSRPIFIVFITLLILVAVWEVAGAFARRDLTIALPPVYLGAIAMIVAGATAGPFWVMASLYFTFVAVVVWRLASSRLETRPIADVMASVFVAVYVPFMASFLALISGNSPTAWPIIFFVVIVALNDIGGWLVGIMIGKHPMSPRLSPKKSWEGFAGSVAFCVAGGIGSTFVMEIPWWWGLIFGFGAAILGTLGDLTESLIKRDVGLKDMSNIVPGHGGLMDRLDSMLFAAPAFYFFYALAFGWWA